MSFYFLPPFYGPFIACYRCPSDSYHLRFWWLPVSQDSYHYVSFHGFRLSGCDAILIALVNISTSMDHALDTEKSRYSLPPPFLMHLQSNPCFCNSEIYYLIIIGVTIVPQNISKEWENIIDPDTPPSTIPSFLSTKMWSLMNNPTNMYHDHQFVSYSLSHKYSF